MNFIAAVIGFPLLLAFLAVGCGFLLESLSASRLPAMLLVPAGFAVLVVVSQIVTWNGSIAPASPLVLLALALTGFIVGRRDLAARWRSRRRGWWLVLLVPAAAYLVLSAPTLAAGRLTFPGYLTDTTAGIQLAGGERILHFGHNFTDGFPGYGAAMVAFFGYGYPSGSQTTLSSVGWLSGQDLLWLYFPYQAAAVAFGSLPLMSIASRCNLSRTAAAVTGFLAAVSALVYSYALVGSIKELTALPLLLLMGALAASSPGLRAGARATIPFAVAGAAAVGAIGFAALAWVVPFALAYLIGGSPRELVRRIDLAKARCLAVRAAVVGAGVVILALPTFGSSKSFGLAKSLSGQNVARANDPGYLRQPLHWTQMLGVWLAPSHLTDPKYVDETYAAIGLVLVCVTLGLLWLLRTRNWRVLAFVGIAVAVWFALNRRGTEWTDAKVLMLLSPVAMTVALVGAFTYFGRRAIERTVIVGAVAIGILTSDALAYHYTNLAPTQRFSELRSIGERFSGDGPTLTNDFDEYTLYLLRGMAVNGPGLASHGSMPLTDGSEPLYGHSYDLDSLSASALQSYRYIVERRSPVWSRPPGNYTLVWRGNYYEVWRRTAAPPLRHLGFFGGVQASLVPSCRLLRRLATRYPGRTLVAAQRAENVLGDIATSFHSPNAVLGPDITGRPALQFAGPARVELSVRIRETGAYRIWLGGSVDRPFPVYVDHRLVGAPRNQSGGDDTMIQVGTVQLTRGEHPITLLRGGGGLAPGNNTGATTDALIFEPLSAEQPTLGNVPAARWRSLCGQPLDWIEVWKTPTQPS